MFLAVFLVVFLVALLSAPVLALAWEEFLVSHMGERAWGGVP